MKFTLSELKKLIPNLPWQGQELADKLSVIGHETVALGVNEFDVTTTSNRTDCKKLPYLAFDLAGVYGLETTGQIISYQPGRPIKVTAEQINRLLGSQINQNNLRALERLGFEVGETSVTPPGFRDVETVADVAEEIGRVIGYDQLRLKKLDPQAPVTSRGDEQQLRLRLALSQAGLTETRTSSFSPAGSVELKNPFSADEPFLRPSLQRGLLQTLARNPYLKRATFFEIGHVFTPREEWRLGIIIAGYKNTIAIEAGIVTAIGQKITFQPIAPNICQQLDVKQSRVIWSQIGLDDCRPTANDQAFNLPAFKPISKFPPLLRDITIPRVEITKVEKFQSEYLLFAEQIDEYADNVTYRFLFQKMSGSFTELEINALSQKLERHFFPDTSEVK